MAEIKLTKKKIIIIFVALAVVLAAAAVLLVLFFNGQKPEAVSFAADDQAYEEPDSSYKDVFSDDSGNTLTFNSANGFIAFKNAKREKVWASCTAAASDCGLSSLVDITVRDKKGNSYNFNSTDNSVAFGTFEPEIDKNSLSVTFTMFKSETEASKGFDENGLCIKLALLFSLDDGKISASVDCSKIELSKGLTVEKISIMPGLLSVKAAENGDTYTLPDGCGSVIDLACSSQEDLSAVLPVYGADVSYSEYKAGATLPCFACTSSGSMLDVLITDGDALSELTCSKKKDASLSELYNTFLITPYSESSDKVTKGVSYKGIISQSYIFSDGTDNDYNAVAFSVRDLLIKKEYLPDSTARNFVDLPLFLTVVGSVDGKEKSKLTSFEDAAEIISLLNSKGVKNIALRFVGAQGDGLNQAMLSKTKVSDVLGGNDKLQQLCKTASLKNSTVWLDVNITSGGTASAGADLYPEIRGYLNSAEYSSKLASTDTVFTNLSSAVSLMSSFESLNVSINDASFLLYSDASTGLTRQDMLEEMSEKINSLSVYSQIMLSHPAVWLMKSAVAVSEMPQTSSLSGKEGVTDVPLLQLTVHGSVCYAGEPLNVSGGTLESVLKSIEFGAVPSFLFTYENSDNLAYGSHAAQTAKYYSKVKTLKSVIGLRMTSHEQVAPGVYKITYDYNKSVYVNYNPSMVNVNGILIESQSFLVV